MKKVLFLVPTLSAGGAEKVLCNLVNHMDFNRFDVTVQTIVDTGVFKKSLRPEIHYKTIAKSNAMAYLVQFVLSPAVVYKLFIKKRKAYDAEVAFLEGSAAKILSGSSNRRAKKFAWIHTDLRTLDENTKVFPTEKKAKDCYEKFDKIICVSRGVRDGFCAKYDLADRAEVRYNAFDDVAIREKAEAFSDVPQGMGLRMVAAGRLVPLKGYDRLLRVMARLKENGTDCSLTLVGDGPEADNLKKLALELELEDRVCFVGFQENPYPYIKNAQLCVCSSIVEGFSTVATEALLLGVPVVATDCAGMRDLLGDNEFGMITENSEDGLYRGIRAFCRNRALMDQYRGKTSKRAESFRLKSCVEQIQIMFE
ncbi:MAG: glycosyltransferase [Clostridia bacterium]|nr:glycosyltransferase [Clostridia bacterium]